MKISYQIFIVLFVLISLFIVKDDIKLIASNVSTYLNLNNEDVKSATDKFQQKSEELLPSKIIMPGALRVVDNILNSNTSKLSKNKIIELTNSQRNKNGGLAPLKENTELNASALKKMKDMFAKQYFEHMSPSNIGVGDLGQEAGYEYIVIGENLAMGNFKDDKALVDAWMASTGHRANILNAKYIDIGVAVGTGNFKGKNIWMAVQHFGVEKDVCPAINPILIGIITLKQDEVKRISDDLIIRKEMIDKKVIYKGSTVSEQIDQYNTMLTPYNELIKYTKQKIEEYNKQIRAFNTCILKYQ